MKGVGVYTIKLLQANLYIRKEMPMPQFHEHQLHQRRQSPRVTESTRP